jgi:hypothetical protein
VIPGRGDEGLVDGVVPERFDVEELGAGVEEE